MTAPSPIAPPPIDQSGQTPPSRATIAPIARLARRRSDRDRRQGLLLIAAIALPVTAGSLVVPATLGPSPAAVVFLAVVAATIALSVGAVLAVSTRRQLLRFGRLSAIGADPVQIRWLLAFESLPPAAFGHLVGAGVGTALSVTVGPLRWMFDDAVSIGPLGRTASLTLFIALGQIPLVLASGLGLWLATGPAVRLAERSPTETLAAAGPEPEPHPFQGRLGLGLVTLAICYCLVAEFSGTGLTLAVVAVFVGINLLMAPVLIRLDALAAHLPRSMRLATRNGVRSRTRFGRLTMASIATVALGVMAVAGILSDAPGNAASGRGWGLDDRFVLVPSGLLDTEAEDRIRSIVDVTDEAEFQVLTSDLVQIWARDDNGYSASDISTAVLTPELAAALDADADTLDAADRGAIILPDGSRRSLSTLGADGPGPDLEVHTTRLGLGYSRTGDPMAPGRIIVSVALVSAERAAELEARPAPAERYLLLVADRPLSGDQRDRLAHPATASVLISDPSHDATQGPTFVRIVTGIAAGFLIAFGLMGAALSGAETEHEISAMIANGADPAIRRWHRANQSVLQLALAGLVGSPLGVLLFWAITRTDPSVPDPIVPWETIGVLAVGVPIVVAALVAVSTRTGSPAMSQRGLA